MTKLKDKVTNKLIALILLSLTNLKDEDSNIRVLRFNNLLNNLKTCILFGL